MLTDDESVELAAASLTGVWPLALHAASVLSSPLAMPTTTYRIVKVTYTVKKFTVKARVP